MRWLLKFLNLDVPSDVTEQVGVRHHRLLHFMGHLFGLGMVTGAFAHFKVFPILFLAAVFPLVWELGVDGHLRRIVSGVETDEELLDLRSDLISWYAGFLLGLVCLI